MKKIAIFISGALLAFDCSKEESEVKNLTREATLIQSSSYQTPTWVISLTDKHNLLLDELSQHPDFPFNTSQERQEAALLTSTFSVSPPITYQALKPLFEVVWSMEGNNDISLLVDHMLDGTPAGEEGVRAFNRPMLEEFAAIYESAFSYIDSNANSPSISQFNDWANHAIQEIANYQVPQFNQTSGRAENVSAILIASIEVAKASYEYWDVAATSPSHPWHLLANKNKRKRQGVFGGIWRGLKDAYHYFVNPCWSTGFDNPDCPGICMDLECAGDAAGAASSH